MILEKREERKSNQALNRQNSKSRKEKSALSRSPGDFRQIVGTQSRSNFSCWSATATWGVRIYGQNITVRFNGQRPKPPLTANIRAIYVPLFSYVRQIFYEESGLENGVFVWTYFLLVRLFGLFVAAHGNNLQFSFICRSL